MYGLPVAGEQAPVDDDAADPAELVEAVDVEGPAEDEPPALADDPELQAAVRIAVATIAIAAVGLPSVE